MPLIPRRGKARAGAKPGIESIGKLDQKPSEDAPSIEVFYVSEEVVSRQIFDDIHAAFGATQGKGFRWININGLHPYLVNACHLEFGIHTLHAEDVLHVHQRPRLESEDSNYLFILTRMLMRRDEALASEQISMFLFDDVLLTIQ
ncbi:MAG TPA: hypothetical protein DCR55_16495, partial [Lentisphaeria bacterium]|nr:hypothetical protein [Lentisphaeria bacterium]